MSLQNAMVFAWYNLALKIDFPAPELNQCPTLNLLRSMGLLGFCSCFQEKGHGNVFLIFTSSDVEVEMDFGLHSTQTDAHVDCVSVGGES